MVPSRDLVPGDVNRLHIGDISPADTRLSGEESLEFDHSALTVKRLTYRLFSREDLVLLPKRRFPARVRPR